MTGYEGETRQLQRPCPFCGGTTFIRGMLLGHEPQRFYYKWDGGSAFLEKLRTKVNETEARMCETCRNIQVFGVDPEEERS
jgi:hypothetical protein